ncbi:MAG: DUF6364 family protein [Nonlabens sp.]
MNTKLTLTIQQEIINRAKEYAKSKNRSLSDLIEHYLKAITIPSENTKIPRTNSVVDALRGSFKMPPEIDYKKELKNRVKRKYS